MRRGASFLLEEKLLAQRTCFTEASYAELLLRADLLEAKESGILYNLKDILTNWLDWLFSRKLLWDRCSWL
jgi:hypothetical protein